MLTTETGEFQDKRESYQGMPFCRGAEQKRSNPRSCKWQGTREQCSIGTIAGKNELVLSHLDQDSVPWGKWPNSAWASTRAILEP